MQTAALALERLADDEAFARCVAKGLSGIHKSLPCRFLYDARGSALFERITELPEYYPTRTEIALLEARASEIAALAGPGVALVEFGSGSSRKTRILLDALEDIGAYVPIDIAEDALFEAASLLAEAYPDLPILPLHADFASAMQLPLSQSVPRLGFFPGSTIGNFSHTGAEAFLRQARRLLGAGSALLIGVDLRKDESILVPAYNDASGVTAAFNLNLLDRINRELEGDIDVGGFTHEGIWNPVCGRMEMYLVSLKDQAATILGRNYRFAQGERIHTEHSHKYTVEQFKDLAARAGWLSNEVWIDDDCLFSLHLLRQY